MPRVRLEPRARIAVIGAGPSGLASAKHALQAGFDVSVFEAGNDLGGQWCTTASYSGVWPGMVTNTSRSLTAFSDFPHPPGLPLHPRAGQIHDYLRAYSDQFGVTPTIRWGTPVRHLEGPVGPDGPGGWRVDGEPFDAVVIASGRFRRPHLPPHLDEFAGELLHAFDYPGATAFADRRALVYGNGISGHEIASDIAAVAPVVSAYRKPRYVLQKVVDGVSSDWQWYTQFGAWQRKALPRGGVRPDPARAGAAHRRQPGRLRAPEPGSRHHRRRPLPVAGLPDAGRPRRIICRPNIASVDGHTVTFADGRSERVDATVCATGYDLDIPYLTEDLRGTLGTRRPPRARPAPLSLHPQPGPAQPRRGRSLPRPGTLFPAAGAAGSVGRRDLGRRHRSAHRRGGAAAPGSATGPVEPVEPVRQHDGRRDGGRAGPARAPRSRRGAGVRPDAAATLSPRRTRPDARRGRALPAPAG